MTALKPIDGHVHLVGDGTSGSGCCLNLGRGRRLLARFVLSHAGIPQRARLGGLDRLYVDRLRGLVRESSLNKAVLLAQDRIYDDSGRVMDRAGLFHVPNDYVLNLASDCPDFLAAVSIHPAREDALDELERCARAGAVMMKCLPNYHNIDPGLIRYRPFWEKMADLGLPLLAHTGGERVLPVVRRDLEDPRCLEAPLRAGVNVIAAHCGTPTVFWDRDYFGAFVGMLQEYPNLYGDVSAFSLPLKSRYIKRCLSPEIQCRLIHGSDFPVPVNGHWSWLRGLLDWKTYRRWERCGNPLERDYRLKRAFGFSDEVFTRIETLFPCRPRD